MMGNRANMSLKLFLTLAALSPTLTVWSFAETFTVGGNSEWIVPHDAALNYTVWAQNVSAHVGDKLHFKYNPNGHNVQQVTKDVYTSCNTSNSLKIWDDGDSTVPLMDAGTLYFICGSLNHCSMGQAFAIDVAPSVNSSGPAGPTVLSPPSAASSHGHRSWAVVIATLVVLMSTGSM